MMDGNSICVFRYPRLNTHRWNYIAVGSFDFQQTGCKCIGSLLPFGKERNRNLMNGAFPPIHVRCELLGNPGNLKDPVSPTSRNTSSYRSRRAHISCWVWLSWLLLSLLPPPSFLLAPSLHPSTLLALSMPPSIPLASLVSSSLVASSPSLFFSLFYLSFILSFLPSFLHSFLLSFFLSFILFPKCR